MLLWGDVVSSSLKLYSTDQVMKTHGIFVNQIRMDKSLTIIWIMIMM